MTTYHAVLLDETGCEFGHTFTAASREDAWDELQEMFPESQCVQLESPEDTAARERRMYARLEAEMDGDCYYDDDY